jgi:ketosteroid isomerase-like protein
MSRENVEVVRAVWKALNRRDVDAAFAFVAPDCEVDMSRAVGPVRRVHTADEWREVTRECFANWESSHWEVAEYIDSGEHVITPVTNRLQGRSGIEVQARVSWVWWLRDGLVQRIAIYQERAAALEAAGLSE